MRNDIDHEDADIMFRKNKNNKTLDVASKKKLVLFTKRHVHSKSWGVNTYHNYSQVFSPGSYTTDEALIAELIESKADVEIYERAE